MGLPDRFHFCMELGPRICDQGLNQFQKTGVGKTFVAILVLISDWRRCWFGVGAGERLYPCLRWIIFA